jgi:hypothetical protein
MDDRRLTRRNVLRGAGVALALPWLESLAPRTARGQAAPPRRRFVAMYFPSGTAEYWKPKTTGVGDAWSLSPILEPLAPVKADVNVLMNVGNYGPFGGHIEPADSNLGGAVLTCCKPPVHPELNVPFRGGTSVDQVIAQGIPRQTRLESLQVGLSTLDSYTDGLPGPFSRSISWRSPTEPLYKLVSPQAVFDRIFGGAGAAAPDARRATDKSILDFVAGHAATVRGQVGASDRARLDQFLTSVRSLESDLAAACRSGARPTQTYAVGYVPADYDRGKHADQMIDLVTLALQCDVTRVVSFMLDDTRSDFVYSFLTRRHFTDEGSTPSTGLVGGYNGLCHAGNKNDGWATVNRWFVEKLARLAGILKRLPEDDGTMLDHTAIWFGSEMHGGNEDGLDLPIVTVGSGGGRLVTGRCIDFASTTRQTERLANLHLTFIRSVFDLPNTAFGTGPSTGGGIDGPLPPYTFGAGTAVIPELLA